MAVDSKLTDVFKIRMFTIITPACFFVSVVDVALLVILCDTSFLTHQGELNKSSL